VDHQIEPERREQLGEARVRPVDLERTTAPQRHDLQPRQGIDDTKIRGHHPRDIEVHDLR